MTTMDFFILLASWLAKIIRTTDGFLSELLSRTRRTVKNLNQINGLKNFQQDLPTLAHPLQ
jgi:hypothetical protein